MDQGIILPDDLQRMRQTIQQIQLLLPTVDRANNLQLRRSLARAIHDILQHYGEACQQRHMRLLDEVMTNQYIGDWHRLKQQCDLKNRENQHILLILQDIGLLIRSWQQQQQQQHQPHSLHRGHHSNGGKNLTLLPSLSTLLTQRLSASPSSSKRNSTSNSSKKKTISSTTQAAITSTVPVSSSLVKLSSTTEEILTSILTTFDYPPGAYTVIVDKHNCGQLGLQHSKIGTRQIIFDSHQLSSNDILETITQLCDTFASLFASTAHHHLAQIDSQIRKAQPFYTSTHMKRLSARIFEVGDAASTIMEDGDYDNGVEPSLRYQDDQVLPDTMPAGSIHRPLSAPPHSSTTTITSSSSSSSMAVLTPFRLTMTTPHMLRHLPIPIPSFVPAPWQLPDLLKQRYPYNSHFFGLIRRRANYSSNGSNNNSINGSISTNRKKHPQQSVFLKHAQQQPQAPDRRTSINRGQNSGHPHYRTAPTVENNNNVNKNASNTSPAPFDHYAPSPLIDEGIDNNTQHHSFIQPRATTSMTTPLQRRGSKLHRTKHFVSSALQGNNTNGYGDDWDGSNTSTRGTAPFTSVSAEKLSLHLGKIAGQFYQDLLMHTRMRYEETQTTLESLEWQMMDLYRHLQLASSRAVMQRAIMIIHELDERQHSETLDLQQHQQTYYQQYLSDGQCNNERTNNPSDSISSSTSSDEQQSTPWKPICTEKYQGKATADEQHSEGTTTTTSEKEQPPDTNRALTSATPMATRSSTTLHTNHQSSSQDDDDDTVPRKTALSKTEAGLEKQLQQQNNPALSITSSFKTAASGLA